MVDSSGQESSSSAIGNVSQHSTNVWRPGDNGVYAPFTNFDETVSVMDQAQAKKQNFDPESFISEKICEFAKTAHASNEGKWVPLESKVYFCKKQGYVKVNKVDADKGTCICVVQKSDQSGEVAEEETAQLELAFSELDQSMYVSVKTMTDKTDSNADCAQFKVSIDAPVLEQVTGLYKAMGVNVGGLLCREKFVDNEDTCLSLRLKSEEMLLAAIGGGWGGPLMRWDRCKIMDVSLSSSWYMSQSNWDSVLFTPQRKVRICGFGIFGPKDQSTAHGWSIKFRWKIEDGSEMSETYIFKSSDDTFEEDLNKIHRCVFKEHDAPDFVVDEGVKFHLMQAYDEGPKGNHRYLSNGNYDQIEQEKDFIITEKSSHDNNCTSQTQGQIPYLLYQQL